MGVKENDIYKDFIEIKDLSGLKQLFNDIEERSILIAKGMEILLEDSNISSEVKKIIESKTVTIFFW